MEKSQNIMKLIAGCDVIKFEIYLIFLIKPFFYMTKKSRQKLKYLRTKRAFYVKQKSFFIIFKGLSFAKNCLRPESAPLRISALCRMDNFIG